MDKNSKNARFVTVPKSFLNSNILLWAVANYVIYYFFESIIVTIVSGVLFFAAITVFFLNRRYLKDPQTSCFVAMIVVAYWFLLVVLSVLLLQIKISLKPYFYIVEIALLGLMMLYSQKRDAIIQKSKILTRINSDEAKAKKTAASIVALLLSYGAVYHIDMSESQSLFAVSLALFYIAMILFLALNLGIKSYLNHFCCKQ